MAQVKFTEKELGFINECTIDKKGVLTSKPAAPFPSLYKKGVLTKGDDGAIKVAKEFRDMFYLDSQVIEIDLTKDDGEAKVEELEDLFDAVEEELATSEDEEVEYAYEDEDEVLPGDYAAFRVEAAAGLKCRVVKDKDLGTLIDKVKDIYTLARRCRAENGSEGGREERSDVLRRRTWRFELAEYAAKVFDVGFERKGYEAVFMGDLYMCGACELAYEYLCRLGNNFAQRTYDEALFSRSGVETKGLYNQAAEEFIGMVKARLKPAVRPVVMNGEVVGHTVVDLDEAE